MKRSPGRRGLCSTSICMPSAGPCGLNSAIFSSPLRPIRASPLTCSDVSGTRKSSFGFVPNSSSNCTCSASAGSSNVTSHMSLTAQVVRRPQWHAVAPGDRPAAKGIGRRGDAEGSHPVARFPADRTEMQVSTGVPSGNHHSRTEYSPASAAGPGPAIRRTRRRRPSSATPDSSCTDAALRLRATQEAIVAPSLGLLKGWPYVKPTPPAPPKSLT